MLFIVLTFVLLIVFPLVNFIFRLHYYFRRERIRRIALDGICTDLCYFVGNKGYTREDFPCSLAYAVFSLPEVFH